MGSDMRYWIEEENARRSAEDRRKVEQLTTLLSSEPLDDGAVCAVVVRRAREILGIGGSDGG